MVARYSKVESIIPVSIKVFDKKTKLHNYDGFFVSKEVLFVEKKPLKFVLLNTYPQYLDDERITELDTILLHVLPPKFCSMEEIIEIARRKLGIVSYDITRVYYWHNYRVQRKKVYPVLLQQYGDWVVKKYEVPDFKGEEYFLIEKDGKQVELILNFKEGYEIKELQQ